MNELREQIARARRRLVFEQFLARSVTCLFVTFIVAVVAIALPRLIAVENLPERWDQLCILLALVLGLAAASVWTFISRRTPLDAAIEIDRRFELRERIASTLSISDAERDTEAGHALIHDAIRSAKRIDINDKFRLRFSKRAAPCPSSRPPSLSS